MKKLLITLLLALLVLSMSFALISCDDQPDTPKDTDGQTESESLPGESDGESETEAVFNGIADTEIHKIVENGVANYAVIRAESASKTAISLASELYQYLAGLSSEMVRFETDYTMDYLMTGAHNQETYEIIIGNTMYEQSAKVYEGLGLGEYVITTVGHKILIASKTDNGIAAAITELTNVFKACYDESGKTLSVSAADIEKRTVFNTFLNGLPALGSESLECQYDCGDSSDMLIYNDFTEEMMNEYVTKLKELGYKEHTSTELNENKFVTLTSESKILNVSLTKADKKMRVIFDNTSKFSLPEYDADWDSSKKVCDTLLIQVGTSPLDNETTNGECYVIRCEDGRFIVYDGGHPNNEEGLTQRNCHVRLYNVLKRYTPEGMETRIAAWVFTHGHSDHVGAFTKFGGYASEIKVDQFIYNFPSTDPNLNTYGYATTRGTNSTMEKFTTAEKVKAHPGQIFKFANVEIEVLYSLEFYAPEVLDYYNTSSIVTRVYAHGQSVLMPGDMSPDGNKICRKYYGDYLQSDFYQVTHHGFTGGSNEFNKLVAPKWVLWPLAERTFASHKAASTNSWLSDPSSSVEIIFPAFFNTTVIPLPFDGKTESYTVYPNE